MVFSSQIFLFLFLPSFLAIYYLTPFRYRSAVILLGSYSFYAWWRIDFLLLFIGVTIWSYLLSLLVERADRHPVKKHWLLVGIAGNLCTLGYFKYANFGVESLNVLLQQIGLAPLLLGQVILPIGISFYIFQAISYLVDVYRGDTPPARRFVDFAAFIALFPQLIAGPVLRYKDLVGQFSDRRHTYGKFAEGASRFMQGFIKKVFIADTIAPIVDIAFNGTSPSMADAWLGALVYTIQLYFDFSGYSDMAIGLGLMMGFRFVENFHQPYMSQSITEFWRRWHMSLSSWLRDYLYIPLGGSRKGELKTYRNLFLTMFLGGLWHGANWTFVLWGMWHGCWLAVERLWGIRNDGTFRFFNWMFCMFLILMGWVLFRSENLSQAWRMYRSMFGAGDVALSVNMGLHVSTLQVFTLTVALLVIGINSVRSSSFRFKRTVFFRQGAPLLLIVQVPLFVLSISKLIASNYSPFLYFQF